MSGFLGRYEHSMDKKGRVSLPAAFRPGGGQSFVLLQWKEPALTLFPQSAWSGIQERLLSFRRANPEASERVLWLTSNATIVTPDSQNRILIPQWLKEAAALEGPVLLVGALDRVEIWNPETFRSAVPGEEASFDRFAGQIFG